MKIHLPLNCIPQVLDTLSVEIGSKLGGTWVSLVGVDNVGALGKTWGSFIPDKKTCTFVNM